MQRFQNADLLMLLWLIIPLIGLAIWNYRWKAQTIASNFSSRLASYIIPYGNAKIQSWKWIFIIGAVILMIIGLANPQKGIKKEKIKGQGIDLMVLVDVSNSMLAQDIQPNRLERSKLFVSKLLDQLHHDRVGLIIFAGNAFLQVPLTIDYSAIKMSLPLVNPNEIPSQGTNIGEAVELATQSLGKANSQNKAIIILTDGENHSKEANSAIEAAKEQGIKTFSIGVGTEQGAKIPIGQGEYKKDKDGNEVVSKLNMDMVKELATIGKGEYYQMGSEGNIEGQVVSQLDKIEKKDFDDLDFSNYISYFYWFLLVALLLIFIEFILPDIPIKSFFKKLAFSLFFMMIIIPSGYSQEKPKANPEQAQTLVRKGNVAYTQKDYNKAKLYYEKSIQANPNQVVAKYNLGNTFYESKEYASALDQYNAVVKNAKNPTTRSKAYHNIGNTYFKQNNLDEAIKSYEQSLMLNPSDMDTKFNLALAKKKRDEDKKNDKNKSGGGGQDQKNKPDQGQGDQKKEGDQGDKKDQSGQGNQDKKEEGEGNQNPQPQNGKMSKEQAAQLLDALKNQEQGTQQKMNRLRQKPPQEEQDEDW